MPVLTKRLQKHCISRIFLPVIHHKSFIDQAYSEICIVCLWTWRDGITYPAILNKLGQWKRPREQMTFSSVVVVASVLFSDLYWYGIDLIITNNNNNNNNNIRNLYSALSWRSKRFTTLCRAKRVIGWLSFLIGWLSFLISAINLLRKNILRLAKSQIL